MLTKKLIAESIGFVTISLLTIVIIFNSTILTLPWIFAAFFVATSYFILTSVVYKRLSIQTEKSYEKSLFRYSLIANLAVMIFLYILNYSLTDTPFSVNAKDELGYDTRANLIVENILSGIKPFSGIDYTSSDLGYPGILAFEYLILGKSVFFSRLLQIVLGAFSVLFTYRIARNFFDKDTAKLAGILMIFYPHILYFHGVTLKETHMVFFLTASILIASNILLKKFTFRSILLLLITVASLFFFRTPLAILVIISILLGFIFTRAPKKRGGIVVYAVVFTIILVLFARSTGIYYSSYESISSSGELYEKVTQKRSGGSGIMSLIGLPIYVIAAIPTPFPSLIDTENNPGFHKANWYHSGGSFVWNVLSFFFIIGMYQAFRRHLFKYLMIIVFTMGYLIILSYSGYVTSLRYTIPVIPFLLIFVAYGVHLYKGKNQLFRLYLVLMFICVIGWSYFQLASRGMI